MNLGNSDYICGINPLNPHDTFKHHISSLKNLFPTSRDFRKKHGAVLIITIYRFQLPFASCHLHLLHVENCDSNSRLLVDEADDGKFSLKRVNPCAACSKTNTMNWILVSHYLRLIVQVITGNCVSNSRFKWRKTTTKTRQQDKENYHQNTSAGQGYIF